MIDSYVLLKDIISEEFFAPLGFEPFNSVLGIAAFRKRLGYAQCGAPLMCTFYVYVFNECGEVEISGHGPGIQDAKSFVVSDPNSIGQMRSFVNKFVDRC